MTHPRLRLALLTAAIGLTGVVSGQQNTFTPVSLDTATKMGGGDMGRLLFNANTADVTANAADTYLTGSSLTIGPAQKAGTILRWRMVATKTAAGTAAATVIVRFGTNGSTSDTARNTFTLSAQSAATDTGHFELTCVVRTINASTGVVACGLDVTHANSTTGLVSANETNVFQVVSGNFDNTSTSLIAGVSVNPGTAGVWTFQLVTAEASNLQ